MKLLTQDQRHKLLANGAAPDRDHPPVVKLFTPDAQCTWLLSEIDPDNQDIAFGLADLGLGYPELGFVSLAEIRQLRGGLGLPVERDLYFEPRHPMSVYAKAARMHQRIVTGKKELEDAST